MDAGTSSVLQETVVGTNSTRRKKNYSRRPLDSIDTATTQVHKKESDSNNCNNFSQNSNSIEKMEREPADSKQPNFRRRRSSKKSEKATVDSSANTNTNQGVTNNFSSYRIISRLQMTGPSIENNRELESVHNPETNSDSPPVAQTHSRRSSKQIKSRNERTRPTTNERETNTNPSDPLINTRVAQQKSYMVDSSIETAETSVHRKEFDPLSTRDVPSQKRSRQRKRNLAHVETSVHTNSLNPTAPVFIPTTKSTISRSTDSVVVSVPVPTQSSITCTICAEENIPFLAVGPCNHPICSMCALRIRFKTKSFDCPICKSLMDVMVVFPHARSTHDYYSFSLPDDEWVYTCPPYPGTELLSVARMIFFDCRDHLKSFEKLISICCPLKDCGRMFPSNRRLLDHLNHQHMGLTICNICLDHRQLFIPEHKVVTKSELKQHMNGTKDSVQSNDPSSSSSLSIQSPRGAEAGDTYFTQGHPRCEFCRSHYFDSSALFSHMQSAHETCHLCPGRMMFRYYRNIASIQQHYRKNHIVCESCYEIEERRLSGEAVAFNTYNDYSTHMTEYHGLSSRDCRIRFENSLQRQTGSSSYAMSSQQQDAGFFDLDMGTANPYYVSSNSNNNNNNNNRNSNNTGGNHSNRTNVERTAPANSAISNVLNSTSSNASISIPPNMQIAGRITGSGRFTAKSESDLLMQAMAEEQANAIKKEHRIMNQWAFKNIRQPDSFPELAVSKGTATASLSDVPTSASAQSSSSTTPHPLSLVNSKQKSILEKKKAAEEMESARTKELELRKIERDRLLTQALLQEDDVPDWRRQRCTSPATLHEELFLSLGGSEEVANDGQRLLHVLWPPLLVHWGQANMTELVKLESRMQELIAEKSMHSYQLKPMDKARRDIVHWISRFYQIRSHEYEPEPKRYISLVKSPQSCVPAQLLSQAVRSSPFIPPNPNLALVPAIYLSLKNVMPPQPLPTQKFEVLGAGRLTPGSGVFTVAELISKIRNLLKVEYNTMGSRMMNAAETNSTAAVPLDILRSGQVGPSTVEFYFRNLRSASEAFKTIFNGFFPNFSLQKAESGSREYTAGQLAHYFEMIPGFTVESFDNNMASPAIVAMAENLTLPAAAVAYSTRDSDNNSSSSSSSSSGGVYSVDHSRFDSGSSSSSWTRVLPARSMKSRGAATAALAFAPVTTATAAATASELSGPARSGLDGEFLSRLRMREDWDDDQDDRGGGIRREDDGSGTGADIDVDVGAAEEDKEWNDFLSSKRNAANKDSLYSAAQAVDKWAVHDHQDGTLGDSGVDGGDYRGLPLAVAVAVSSNTVEDERLRSTSNQRERGNVYSVLEEQEQLDDEVDDYSEDAAPVEDPHPTVSDSSSAMGQHMDAVEENSYNVASSLIEDAQEGDNTCGIYN